MEIGLAIGYMQDGLDCTMAAFDSNVGGLNQVDSLESAMAEAKEEV